MDEKIVADSSFYICCVCDLNRKDFLVCILNQYSFIIGKRISSEISKILFHDDISKYITIDTEHDFFALVHPLFGRNESHETDGEYEAIGIAKTLEISGSLKYLVLDDRRARNFVKRYFPELHMVLTGTIGLIDSICRKDQKISPDIACNFLEAMVSSLNDLKGNVKKRPCNLDKNLCLKVLVPLLKEMREYNARRGN